MARPGAIVAAMKSAPGGARYTPAPQSSGMGRISPVQAEMYLNNSYANTYGPFLPRPSRTFTDGAFAPMSPIQPTPVDEPPLGGTYPGPRWWQYRNAWNLPTPPGSEGLKLASFDQLRTLAQKYSVARAAIELRVQEIRGLRWDITLTTDAAKAYQDDKHAMRDFGERKAQVKKFFKRPDPDFWNFDSFLSALLEEIFVYDALSVIFRPKFGASIGMGGRGLLGSDLDSLNLVAGPTIRPLIDMHGGHPAPPAPAYQQFLYGVPRSDYMTIATGTDIDDAGLAGAEVNAFNSDVMLYAPYWTTRETPYGFPPVERALLPIISGLQKQEFQLDYFTEGTVPAVYISPGDTNITPTQIGELQNALNALAGDPAYHLKVVVLPPGSKVEPQRPVDLSDSFDYLVMNQVCMAFDVQPEELGIIPNVGATPTGPSASGIRFAGQEARDLKSRKSTMPMLQWLCDIFNYVIQDICRQNDMQFIFEGLVNDEEKAAITELGVQQVQNAISSIDEIRERLDLPPWGLKETSEPVVFTAQGPVPLSLAPQLLMAAMQGNAPTGQGTNSGQNSSHRTVQPSARRGGQTKPNGSHPAPVSPHREAPLTPAHSAAAGTIQSPTPRTGGTTSRSSVAGSRKKAIASEFDMLRRHLRKGKLISEWEPRHITNKALGMIAEDIAKGVLLDTAIERAADLLIKGPIPPEPVPEDMITGESPRWWQYRMADPVGKSEQFPGWQHDLGLVGRYKEEISQAFQDAEIKGRSIRKDAATGKMYVSTSVLQGLVSDAVRDVFLHVMNPMWGKAWDLGYDGARELLGRIPVPSDAGREQRQAFLDTEGTHWLDQVSRTGLGNSSARSEIIARTEVARAMNAGAMQCYKDSGVTYKHLLVAPEDACEICLAAKEEGILPLDAIYPGGEPPFHPQCRCVSAPAGIDVEPPQAHIGKNDSAEDKSRLAWLLIRARDEEGHWRYLLQQRDDGSWGMPGGSTHVGEDPWDAAIRETTEEIGDLPPLTVIGTFHHMDDPETRVFVWACEAPFFHPKLNGSTPEETAGTAWFRKKEIGDLDLAGPFRDDWDEGHIDTRALKVLRNLVNETGEQLVLDDPERHGAGLGSRHPYPHRADGTEVPDGHWRDAGPGAVPGNNAGDEPPRHDPEADFVPSRIYPRGSQDDKYPKRRGRNRPASRFPDSDPGEGGMYPSGGVGSSPGPDAISVGAPKNDSGHPVVGTYKPHAYKPRAGSMAAQAPLDPADLLEEASPEGNTVHDVPKGASMNQDAQLADPRKPGGPSDFRDANPVDAEHVYLLMANNFPAQAIEWVKRARWTGPVWVPWNRVDTDDEKKWAADHERAKVNEFVRQIRNHDGHVAPSILVQEPNNAKAFLVDGHHRALARKRLGQDVLAYVGNIDPKDRMAALETHTHQIHQGSDPGNK